MNKLQKLESEKLNLSGMALDIDEHISNAENSLESSFIGGGDSDKLSAKLANLKTKRGSLASAINSTDKAIKQAVLDAEAEEANKVMDTRKDALKLALKALDESHELQIKLAEKLQIVTDEVFKANPNNQEITQSIRGIVGRLAHQFDLFGSLQMSSTLRILNTKNDLEAQQNNLNGWR